MPFVIRKVEGGYMVCKKDNPKRCFSKKVMSLAMAKRQLAALHIHADKKE